ncbi:unnamed protein product, partial [marine sediment metagenome]
FIHLVSGLVVQPAKCTLRDVSYRGIGDMVDVWIQNPVTASSNTRQRLLWLTDEGKRKM